MKNRLLSYLMAFLGATILLSCVPSLGNKEECEQKCKYGSCTPNNFCKCLGPNYSGTFCENYVGPPNVFFYTFNAITTGSVKVYINDAHKGDITETDTNTPFSITSCKTISTNKGLRLSLAPGTYTWKAEGNGQTLTGSVTVVPEAAIEPTCNAIQLQLGPAKGKVVFWASSANSCSMPTLQFNGNNRVLNGIAQAPACGDNVTGTAVYELEPGSYSWTADCGLNAVSGQVQVISGECSFVLVKE